MTRKEQQVGLVSLAVISFLILLIIMLVRGYDQPKSTSSREVHFPFKKNYR